MSGEDAVARMRIMFFQTSAATGGITKNGEITRIRTIPCPKIGWSIRSAMAMPPTTVMSSTPSTIQSVLRIACQKAGIGQEVLVVLQAGPAAGGGVQQVVVPEREVDRHRQRHDHPDEQKDAPRAPSSGGRAIGSVG